jgi:hypothetical protein
MMMPVVQIDQTFEGPVSTIGAMGVVHVAMVRDCVAELAASVTGRPDLDAGALRLARQLERLTPYSSA